MMFTREIEHFTQPTQSSCGQTCVGMLMGVKPEYLGVPLNVPCSDTKICKLAARHQMYLEPTDQVYLGGVYIVIVPSLNEPGGLHAVVVDSRFDELDDVKILDPKKGLEGQDYYTHISEINVARVFEVFETENIF